MTKLLVVFMLCAVPVWAADTAAEREARLLFKDGNRLLDAGDYVGALDSFRSAYQKLPSPKILLNIGTTLRQLGRNVEAVETYERYLHDPQTDPQRKAEVSKIIEELKAKLGTLRIELDVADARVLVDGKAVGGSGKVITVRVEPGEHAIVAERVGVSPAVASVRVAAGATKAVMLKLVSMAGAAKPVAEPKPMQQPAPSIAAPAPRAMQPKPAPKPQASVAAEPVVTPAAPTVEPGPATPALVVSTRARPSRGGPVGLMVRADVDGQLRGAVLAAGVSFDLARWLDVGAAGLVGKRSGFWIGAKAAPGTGALRPRLVLGVPAFFVDDTVRAGIQAGAGLGWHAFPRVDVFIDLTVSYFPVFPSNLEKLVFVPSLGVETRL